MKSSFEPKHPHEQRNFSLYLLSKKGELKPREEPWVVNGSKGDSKVFLNFEAVPGEVVLGCAISYCRRRHANRL